MQFAYTAHRACVRLDIGLGVMVFGLALAFGVVWLLVEVMAQRCKSHAPFWADAASLGMQCTLLMVLLDWTARCTTPFTTDYLANKIIFLLAFCGLYRLGRWCIGRALPKKNAR